MFKWKVEECKLLKEAESVHKKDSAFACEKTTSFKDKIAFIDSQSEGRMTAAVELIKKYKEDLASGAIKSEKDFQGNVVAKTVSLKAWLARNDKFDSYGLCDRDYYHGSFKGFGYAVKPSIQYIDTNNGMSTEEFVNKAFHHFLCECADKEKEWFKTHDEYEIAKTHLQENKYVGLIAKFSYRSDGTVRHYMPKNENEDSKAWLERYEAVPEITLEEINETLEKAEILEAYAKELSKSLSFNHGEAIADER